MKRWLLCIIFILWLPFVVFSQDDQDFRFLRLAAGLGIGGGAKGGGLSGRASLHLVSSKWGGMIRVMAQDGGKGTGGGWFGPPIENFYDNAILVTRNISFKKNTQMYAAVGIGSFYGRALNQDRSELHEIGRIPGFAFDIGIATYKTRVGYSFNLIGDINKETMVVGLVVSITGNFFMQRK